MALAASTNPIVSSFTARDTQLAASGALYTAVNPTPGTGIVGPVATTFDEAKALMTVYNGGQNYIYPLSLVLWVTVVGTTGTRQNYTLAIDGGNRYSSGGSVLTKANTNMAEDDIGGAIVNFGALVTTAASGSRRLLGNRQIREAVIEVVGDQYTFVWGGSGDGYSGTARAGAAVGDFVSSFPAVAIGPGQTMSLHHWRGAITVGVTFEASFTYAEK